MTDTSSTWILVGFLVFMFAIFYFLIVRPQRQRQQEQQKALAALKVGDRVITIGGVYGQIDSMDERSVVIRVESGALLRVHRQAISGKQEEPQPPA